MAKLAVFADASDIAMATCAYIFDNTSSSLVMARCKLPSIRSSPTIPKMEMNALTMAARLAWSVYRALQTTAQSPSEIILFSDSQIALNWLSIVPMKSNVGVLVRNRVKEIREIATALNENGVSIRCGYINTHENPADVGTRGLTREQLQNHDLWWKGPNFFSQPELDWNIKFYPFNVQGSEDSIGTKVLVNSTIMQTETSDSLMDLNRFSSFLKVKRVTARILIFLKKLLRSLTEQSQQRIYTNIPELRNISNSTVLKAADIRTARFLLIRKHQTSHLSKEYRRSMENTLRLFKDNDNIWRSRGRLQHSTLKTDAKSPIFIAPNTRIAFLIIRDAHGPYHQGIEHTISTVRQTYWIPKIRQQVRKLVQQCMGCRRFNALPYPYPETTDLPKRRVCRSRPFQRIGLDFFDLPPDTVTPDDHHLNGCIFTCTVTRLIHLEILENASTVEFINALRRFVARRGLPRSITCDNAPTFLLASTLLQNSSNDALRFSEEIEEILANKEIEWKHITPYAPWQGGFYERLIKSVKHALYKALRGSAQRSRSHLHTILTEIEACLNSRPLTYQNASQEDLSSVRPIDFLERHVSIMLPIQGLFESQEDDPGYVPPDESRALQSRQDVINALKSSADATERFWKIWQNQYLTSLREKQKAFLKKPNHNQIRPKAGDIVLVCDPVLPRNEWRMARITAIRQGEDGATREVELITAKGRKIRRPVNLITPLEIDSSTIDKESDNQNEEIDGREKENTTSKKETTKKYNLRPRRPKSTPAEPFRTQNPNPSQL